MMPELQQALKAAREMSTEQLLELLGNLEVIRATALLRLTTVTAVVPLVSGDELLNVNEAANRLGISPNYLYRQSGQFPFTRRIGRKLLFSSFGIDNYIRQRRK